MVQSPLKNTSIDLRNFYDPHRLETFEDDFAVKAIPAMFITTPLLNFDSQNVKYNDFFKYLAETDPALLSMLSYGSRSSGSSTANTSPFIKLLSNRFESFNTKATTSQPREIGETFYGYKQYLPGPYVNSVNGDTVSIEYTERGNMDILYLHKAWGDYIEGLSRGILKPSKYARRGRYLDFTSSIYLFSLAPDGETIMFYERLAGCSPISIPYDAFSSKTINDREIIRYSIEYAYSYKEDLNPRSLVTFNALATNKTGRLLDAMVIGRQGLIGAVEEKPDYKNSTDMYDESAMNQAYNPVIIQSKDAYGHLVFKLKYVAPNT